VRPERCWPLAVGVVRWTGNPRGGRVGGLELPRRCVVVLRCGWWSARCGPLSIAGSCQPTLMARSGPRRPMTAMPQRSAGPNRARSANSCCSSSRRHRQISAHRCVAHPTLDHAVTLPPAPVQAAERRGEHPGHSRTRSSVTAPASSTTSRRPCADTAVCTSSVFMRPNRSRCSITTVATRESANAAAPCSALRSSLTRQPQHTRHS
jgi:hypothetical protein